MFSGWGIKWVLCALRCVCWGCRDCPHHDKNVKDEPKPQTTQGKAEGAGTRVGVQQPRCGCLALRLVGLGKGLLWGGVWGKAASRGSLLCYEHLCALNFGCYSPQGARNRTELGRHVCTGRVVGSEQERVTRNWWAVGTSCEIINRLWTYFG